HVCSAGRVKCSRGEAGESGGVALGARLLRCRPHCTHPSTHLLSAAHCCPCHVSLG
ncbi:unnamed protein product, partial [Closterium sp. Yama58-4]